MFDAGRLMFDVWILDEEQERDAPATGGREILDFGFWILDFGFWILDFGWKRKNRGGTLQPLGKKRF
jgi:hypothetical protein